MSRPGNPYDNAFCESFIKTLKREQIYANKYQYIDELNAHLEEFIDHYYNRLRLHSALGYKTPEEFEAACAPPNSLGRAEREFSQAWGNLSILETAQRPATQGKRGAGSTRLPGSSDR